MKVEPIRMRWLGWTTTSALAAAIILGQALPTLAGDVIDNGTIALGVNDFGNLITENIGITFLPTNGESLAPGCDCEGWGIADFGVAATGFGRSQSNGNTGTGTALFALSGTGTNPLSGGSSAISTVDISVGGNPYANVVHDFKPSPSTNLYRVDVTIRNTSGAPIADMRYRRVMDWDVPPTTFNEIVSIQGHPATRLVATTNDGFEDPNPNVISSIIATPGAVANANFANAGPDDHGALFDFSFGTVAPEAEISFIIYYGAAANEADALAALGQVGAEVYSLGKPSTNTGTPDAPIYDGAPNTFIFAFAGVGGVPLGGAGLTPEMLHTLREFGFLAARTQMNSIGMRMDGTVGGGERNPTAGLTGANTAGLAAAPSDLIQGADFVANDAMGVEGLRMFANGGYNFGNLKAFNGDAKTEYGMPYLNVGMDYGGKLSDSGPLTSALFGFAAGYASIDGNVSGGSSSDAEAYSITGYMGANFLDGGYADAAVGHTWLNYDWQRDAGLGGFDAKTDGAAFSLSSRIGYDFLVADGASASSSYVFKLGPVARLDYVNADIDGFTESLAFGLGAPLTFPNQHAESLTTQLGLRSQYSFDTGYGVASLMGWAMWEHQFENGAETIALSAGTANIGAPDRDYGRIGARLAFHLQPSVTLAAEWESVVFSDELSENSIMARARFDF